MAFHFISCLVLYCIVLFYGAPVFAYLFLLIFNILATSAINLNLKSESQSSEFYSFLTLTDRHRHRDAAKSNTWFGQRVCHNGKHRVILVTIQSILARLRVAFEASRHTLHWDWAPTRHSNTCPLAGSQSAASSAARWTGEKGKTSSSSSSSSSSPYL